MTKQEKEDLKAEEALLLEEKALWSRRSKEIRAEYVIGAKASKGRNARLRELRMAIRGTPESQETANKLTAALARIAELEGKLETVPA